MGAELGATTSVFPFNASMAEYLNATERSEIAAEAAKYKDSLLSPDANCKYDQVREKLWIVTVTPKLYDQVMNQISLTLHFAIKHCQAQDPFSRPG